MIPGEGCSYREVVCAETIKVISRALLGNRGGAEPHSTGPMGKDTQDLGDMNFHEKALFVKADVAAPLVVEPDDSVSFAMLPFALSMSPLFGDSVHRMRSVFSD